MILATIFEDCHGSYEISGEVWPFGVFENEMKAKQAFETFVKHNPRFNKHILDVREVELNKLYDATSKNAIPIVTWWYCE